MLESLVLRVNAEHEPLGDSERTRVDPKILGIDFAAGVGHVS